MAEVYDCIIVGAGPAGLGAGLYTARDRMKTLLLEKFFPGGQINNTDRIENYPGYKQIGGAELVMKMQDQVTSFDGEIKTSGEVTKLQQLPDKTIAVHCDADKYIARSVILAPGR